MFTLKRYLWEGTRIPFWYAPAYRDHAGDRWVSYPIPLNFVVRYARALWIYALRIPQSDITHQAYTQGRRDGQDLERRCITDRLRYDVRDLNTVRAWVLNLHRMSREGNQLAKDFLKTPIFQELGEKSQLEWPLPEYILQWASKASPDDLLCRRCGDDHKTAGCPYPSSMHTEGGT